MREKLKQTITTILVIFIISTFSYSVKAGTYDGSREKYFSRKIAHTITPQRVEIVENRIERASGKDTVSIEKLKNFSQKTVFWTGRVRNFLDYPDNYWIYIKPDEGQPFWVYAKKTIRNLDFERTGYRTGVKGNIILKDNKLLYLKAKSVVLIAPSDENLNEFQKKYNISNKFTMNTSYGPVKITNVYYPFILHRIYMHNPHYNWDTIQQISKAIVFYSHKFSGDPLLLTALLNIESAFDMDAVSSSGAIGLGQLMPTTASGLGVDPHDPVQNVGGAAKYFSRQLSRWNYYSDATQRALASYNAGPGAVSRYGGIPPYSETQNYVFFITYLYKEYKNQCNNFY
ncbi:MAG: transglycosylase SLT domain-containing protein [Vulcanimicrobiota bacterium]